MRSIRICTVSTRLVERAATGPITTASIRSPNSTAAIRLPPSRAESQSCTGANATARTTAQTRIGSSGRMSAKDR